MFQSFLTFEGDILLWIQNNLRSEILTPFVIFITRLGDAGFIWIVGMTILFLQKKTRRIGIMGLVTLLLTVIVVNVILKNAVARVRPYEIIQGLTSLLGPQHDYSFPSGHTASSFAAAVVMAMTLPSKIGIPAMVLAFMIALSRLYVGVHYPSDIICAALIGSLIAIIVVVLLSRYMKKDTLQ